MSAFARTDPICRCLSSSSRRSWPQNGRKSGELSVETDEYEGDARHGCIRYTAIVRIPLKSHPRVSSFSFAGHSWVVPTAYSRR